MTAIYDQLERDWNHPLPSAPAAPLEETMDLAAIETDIREGIQDAIAKGEEGFARLRGIAEQHLPSLAKAADTLQGSKIVQALEDAVLSPADEEFIASLVKRLDTAAAEQPSGIDAEPDPAPADSAPAAPAAPSAPVVGGQAS